MYIDTLNSLIFDEEKEGTQHLIKLVKAAIKELPPRCKKVFELSKKEGLTNTEISEYLNISIKAVEAQITKGFKSIRKSVDEKIKPILFLHFFNIQKSFRKS